MFNNSEFVLRQAKRTYLKNVQKISLNYEIAKFSLNEIHMYNKNIFINMQLLIFVHVY